MCVIIVGTADKKPTRSELGLCWGRNPHGAGVASYDSQGRVTWKKGIRDLDELFELIEGFTGPWIAHVRFITVGKNTEALTHPFPVAKASCTSTEGAGNASVLFHNGTWREWQKGMRDLSLSDSSIDLPDGPLSDSRAIAWLCAHKGYRFLRLLPGRFALMTRSRGVRMFPEGGAGWTTVSGVHYSNMDWRRLTSRDGTRGTTTSSPYFPRETYSGKKSSALPSDGEQNKTSRATTTPQPNNPRSLRQEK